MGTRVLLVCLFLVSVTANSADAQKYYNPDILAIINDHGCESCHGGSGGLFVTPYSNLMTTGFDAPVVVAGDSNSLIVKKLKGTATIGSRMPLGGPYLTADEIQIVVQWIMEGAKEAATADVAEGGSTPREFAVFQNYPNPFNPTTVISYQLPALSGVEGSAVSEVRLVVYDVLGNEIAVLVNERKPAGRYSATFDAHGLASGTYLYRLTAGRFSQARKLLLVR
jgi:mono/diheme cytochrome c family protein